MYATKTDLAAYLGINETAVTKEQENTLESAYDIIEAFTIGRIDPIIHASVAKRASLLQYEYITLMPQIDVIGGASSISAMSFSMQMDEPMSELAPKARRALFNAGLMYRGVGMR